MSNLRIYFLANCFYSKIHYIPQFIAVMVFTIAAGQNFLKHMYMEVGRGQRQAEKEFLFLVTLLLLEVFLI